MNLRTHTGTSMKENMDEHECIWVPMQTVYVHSCPEYMYIVKLSNNSEIFIHFFFIFPELLSVESGDHLTFK